ncbi:MAG: peptidase C69 [Bacteroidetes bacterium 4572_112]|nr:MAG: peptidase C69 [Bacteroidetes bacterium 4572_112]
MQKLQTIFVSALMLMSFGNIQAQQDKTDWMGGVPEGCTTVTVGKDASYDGSVMTSHTDDSHRTRSWMQMVAAADHAKGSTTPMYKRVQDNDKAMPIYAHNKIGEIPQVEHTYAFLNTAYPSMNEHQLAIGESTFGGRDELQSNNGLIDCQRLCQLMLERTTTAREAIKMADELLMEYGWTDYGEVLTIADPNEVWHLEIVGPGKGNKGAVWVAQRVPNDHVGVNANASTIKEIDLKNKDYFMASKNIYKVAETMGLWSKKSGEVFRFNHVYAPHSRESVASRRREWRILSILAPSLHLSPTAQDYPFSVKPEKKVTLNMMVSLFKDYYQGTPYDMRRNQTVADKDGKQVISPMANPFMPYDQLELDRINGGWFSVDHESGKIRFLGERTIARWYTMYGTITQSRSWLPDAIGGKVWLAQDNIATSIYVPVYCSISALPESYATPGRVNGFTRKSAWWAFNRTGTLAAQRWGDMHKDVDAVWNPMQKQMFDDVENTEAKALELSKAKKDAELKKFLTDYTQKWGNTVVDRAWLLGDELWTKYDEKF